VTLAKIGHKRGTVTITVVAADIAGCGKSLLLQTISESAKAHHQVFNNRSVVLSQTREHGRRALNPPILSFSSGLRG
jgi:adenylate kinase